MKGGVSKFLNKETIGELAIKHGLNFLQAIVVEKGTVPQKIQYPVITKAIDSTVGGWKNDMFICHNEQELTEAFQKIKSPIVMLQRYIVKKTSIAWKGLAAITAEMFSLL